MVLLHHDTTHLDDFIDEIVDEAENILREKNLKIMCVVAKEGMVITIPLFLKLKNDLQRERLSDNIKIIC